MAFDLGFFVTFRQFFSVRFPLLIKFELGIFVTFLHVFSVGSKCAKVFQKLFKIWQNSPKFQKCHSKFFNFNNVPIDNNSQNVNSHFWIINMCCTRHTFFLSTWYNFYVGISWLFDSSFLSCFLLKVMKFNVTISLLFYELLLPVIELQTRTQKHSVDVTSFTIQYRTQCKHIIQHIMQYEKECIQNTVYMKRNV